MKELKEAFDILDLDKCGVINPQHLKTAMGSLGFDPKTNGLYQMVIDLDKSTATPVSFEYFV